FAHQAAYREIDFPFIAPKEPIQIQGDHEKIEIALFNLLSNAFKFTPAGGRIEFVLKETVEGVRIGVSESGCGIHENDQDRIFEKFQQVHANTKGKAGFGIGLFLVKHFIERHQGTVSCKSEPGAGSVFTICLHKQIPELGEEYIVDGPGRSYPL